MTREQQYGLQRNIAGREELSLTKPIDQLRRATAGEKDKILLARSRLEHLADVVQKRLVANQSEDPLDYFVKLRAAELDLRTCWEILQKFDPDAQNWLNTSGVYEVVNNRFAFEPGKG